MVFLLWNRLRQQLLQSKYDTTTEPIVNGELQIANSIPFPCTLSPYFVL